MNLWLVFLTGLTTGGLSCLALQGGLLASAIAEEDDIESDQKKSKVRTIILFLLAKLIIYALLGFLLGLLGEAFNLTPRAFGFLDIFIALFMLGVALETLKVHPIFRYFLLQPPKFLRKKIFQTSKNKGDFSAILLGLLTVLIPCGITQAMMALAVSTGKPFSGLLIMFIFILGTIPVFFVLGYFATSLSQMYHRIFTKVIAVILIFLAIYTSINGLRLLGVNIRLKSPQNKAASSSQATAQPTLEAGVQKITIKINDNYGYNPSRITLKKDVPVELTLQGDNARGCIRAFVIPSLNLRTIVPENGTTTLKFTPQAAGKINFTCSMGMYDGQFNVE